MDKYKNKYRIASARAPFWDYGWNAAYFVTICTKNRLCWFGDVVDGKMELSAMGKIVQTEWLKTFEMRPDMNLWMGEYVIMPNHFHAIIGIGKNKYNTQRKPLNDTGIRRRDARHCVSTTNMETDTETIAQTNKPKNQFGPQSKNLASIIRGFKTGVTKNARQINPGFAWQPRYYDHIIRDDKSYQNITHYIINKPAKWQDDKFYHSEQKKS
jgi:putative transposase